MHIAFLGNFAVPYTSETHHTASLEELGHTVTKLQESRATAAEIETAATGADLLVWVHTHGWRTTGDLAAALRTLRARGIPVISYHLDRWMGLARQRDIRPDDPYWQLDHWFTVDAVQADWLNTHTSTRAHWLPAGVYGAECSMLPPAQRFDVVFVGSRAYHPEYPYRAKLIDWLAQTYGDRFRHYGGGGRGPVRGAALNQVYADAKIAIGDSLCLDPNYPGRYWSDRIYEATGRGAFMIHPWLAGLDDQFVDGKHVVLYEHGNLEQLREFIDHYLHHPGEREEIRRAGHLHTRSTHTYVHRWAHILEVLGR